jgi:SAM-dependent methyltransferase
MTSPPVASPAACLYCHSTDLVVQFAGLKDRLGFVPGERTFLRCRQCDSYVLDPLPKAEELPGFYPPVYSFSPSLARGSRIKQILNQLEYHLYFRQIYRNQVRIVIRGTGLRSGAGLKHLDVGCGRGLLLQEFRARGFDSCGLDVVPDVVKYLNEELKIPSVCADVSEIPDRFAADSFDLVTAFYLIEHIPNVRETIQNIYRVLKPGGWMAIGVPLLNAPIANSLGSRWLDIGEAPRHMNLPSANGFHALCRDVGFLNVRILPDDTSSCAGVYASSLIPIATTTVMYSQGGLRPLLGRLFGALCLLPLLPLCYFENHFLHRPSHAMLLTRKPSA